VTFGLDERYIIIVVVHEGALKNPVIDSHKTDRQRPSSISSSVKVVGTKGKGLSA